MSLCLLLVQEGHVTSCAFPGLTVWPSAIVENISCPSLKWGSSFAERRLLCSLGFPVTCRSHPPIIVYKDKEIGAFLSCASFSSWQVECYPPAQLSKAWMCFSFALRDLSAIYVKRSFLFSKSFSFLHLKKYPDF